MSLRPNQIPHRALALGLWTARLPLTVAEKVLARGHDTSAWPPVVLFDKIEAGVKEVVGRVTHDQTLRSAAVLQRAEVSKREEASHARARAAEVELDAEARAEARRAQLDAERDEIDAADADGERQIEEAGREAHQRAARGAAARRSAARTTAAKRKQAIDRRAARADAARLSSEADALKAKERAVTARGKALELDGAVQAKRSARRAR